MVNGFSIKCRYCGEKSAHPNNRSIAIQQNKQHEQKCEKNPNKIK